MKSTSDARHRLLEYEPLFSWFRSGFWSSTISVVSVNRLTFGLRLSPLLCYRDTRRWNPIVSVSNQIEILGGLNLTSLSRCVDEANVNRAILRAVLEKAQGDLINELCGRKYARSEDKKIRRIRIAERPLVTRHTTHFVSNVLFSS